MRQPNGDSTFHRLGPDRPADVAEVAAYQLWFQRRPRLAAAVTTMLFLAVTAARWATGNDATVALSMLYALPVSLMAIAWGRLAGIGGGLMAVTLVTSWAAAEAVELSAVGWVSRVVPLVLMGFLLGDASQRLQRAEEQRRRHVARELRLKQAVEINDGLIQGIAAAKWSLEAGRHEAALTALEQTLGQGQRLVSDLIRDVEPRPVLGRKGG